MLYNYKHNTCLKISDLIKIFSMLYNYKHNTCLKMTIKSRILSSTLGKHWMKILSKKVTIIQGFLLVLVQLNFQLFRNELFKKKKKSTLKNCSFIPPKQIVPDNCSSMIYHRFTLVICKWCFQLDLCANT
jgi:hypothetical protein